MHFDWLLIAFFLCGLGCGLLGGLLGIGGGVITVPALYFIFHYASVFEGKTMQIAVATSLATSIVISLTSTVMQIRKKAVLVSILKMLLPGLILGCIGGAFFAQVLSSQMLSKVFGGVAICLGSYFFFPHLPSPYLGSAPNWSLSFYGFIIGSLSSLLGIGGGSLTVPVLLGFRTPMKNTSATSSCSTFITTLVGTISYLILAGKGPSFPNTFGYISIPAFITISFAAFFTAPIGVRLAHTLDTHLIKRVFGCSLAGIGISMLSL